MAILWIEGFDTWQTQALTKSQVRNNLKNGMNLSASDVGLDIIDTSQRNGTGKYLRFHWNAAHSFLNCFAQIPTTYRTVINTSQTWIMGFAFRVSALPATNKIVLCRFNCSGKNALYVLLDSTGKIKLSKASGVDLTDATNTSSISVNTWYYLEVKAKRSTSSVSGDIEVRINGSTVMTPTTGFVQTVDKWTDFCLGDEGNQSFNHTGTGTLDFDDMYLIDDQGSHNTTFLGDCRVETLFPTAAGASTQWTPLNANPNYQQVNEVFADGDTSYNSTSGVGNRDSYAVADLSSLPTTVFGVATYALARVDAAETNRTINTSVRSGGSYSDGPTSLAIASAYQAPSSISACSATAIFETDPSGSVWDGNTVNGLEAGIKLVN